MTTYGFKENKCKKEVYTKEEVEELLKGTVLYEDEEGTIENVPLNDNPKKYDEIEVFGKRADRPLYVKFPANREYFVLDLIRFVDDTFYFYSKEYTVNENSLEFNYSKRMRAYLGGVSELADDINIYITKVVGRNHKIDRADSIE